MILRLSFLLLALAFAPARPAVADRKLPQACLAPVLQKARAGEIPEPTTGVRPIPTERRRVRVPAAEQERTGVMSIEIGERIGEGAMGEVSHAKILDTAGNDRPGVIKAPKSAKLTEKEKEGNQIYKDLSPVYKKFRAKEEQFFVPSEAHIPRVAADGVVEDVVMPLAGPSVTQLQSQGAMMLFRDLKTGKLKGALSQLERLIERNARLNWGQCRALGDLGYARVVIKDIKGGNIVIFGGVENTIEEVDAGIAHFAYIDFGFAEKAGQPVQDGLVKGTMGFMAPEVMMGTPADRAGDVFAAASVMAENLLGMPISIAAKRKEPWVKVLVPPNPEKKIPGVYLFNRDGVAAELEKVRAEFVEAKISQVHLDLFDDMKRFVMNGLIGNPEARIQAFANDPKSIFKLDKLGADLAYADRIPRTALPTNPTPAIPTPPGQAGLSDFSPELSSEDFQRLLPLPEALPVVERAAPPAASPSRVKGVFKRPKPP